MNKKSLFAIITIIVLIGAAAMMFGKPAVNKQMAAAASFSLTGMDGKQIEVGADGQLTIINFWATWCPPCREEMPELSRFAQQHGGDVHFYAVNIKESGDKVREFMVKNNYNMTVLLDKDGDIAKKFNITAIPTTIVLDTKGNIKYRKAGGVTAAELEGVINKM